MSKVDDFVAKVQSQTAPMQKSEQKAKGKQLERVSLNFRDNLGRYQILPLDNVVNDYPYVTLFNTREINLPSVWTNPQTGEQKPQTAWIKILPKSAYIMKDSTGRIVSSLTSEEDQILTEAYTVFDQLFTELDVKNNREKFKELLRKRNYTIFHAYCVNKWDPNDGRTVTRNNFSGLFVTTAKGFMNSVEESMNETTLTDGDASWIPEIYNRNATGRTGYVLFNINTNKTTAGYSVSVSHKTNVGTVKDVVIPEEDLEMMKDPLANFLGWQAKKEEDVTDPSQRRLFNAALIKDAIKFMTQQLAAARMASKNGMTVEQAIQATNDTILHNSQPVAQTNDPMLASGEAQLKVSQVINNNTQPYTNPAAVRVDPISSAPVNNFGGSNYTQPAFGQAPTNNGTDDLPF